MPIYDFRCNECGATFDQLCRAQWQGSVRCPKCGGADLAKLLSAFASPGSGGGSSCGSCSSKNCGSCK